jgi:phage baseplate assembly protein gpV/phage protein D
MKAIGSGALIELTVGGERVPVQGLRALTEVRVQQRLQAPAQCELVFAFGAGDPPDLPLDIGDRFALSLPGAPELLFSGDVTACEHGYRQAGRRTVRVRGYDALHRLRKRQPVRVHVQTSLAELARELVADLGLAVEAQRSGPGFERLLQVQQNDLELLEEVAERSGLYLALDGQTLRLIDLGGYGEAITLTLGDQLLEAAIEINGDSACRGVAALGWDIQRAEARQGAARTSRVGRTAAASAAPDLFGADGQCSLTGLLVQDDGQADALAQGSLDRRSAQEVVLRATAEGDPALRPGRVVRIAGVAPEQSGCYVLSAVLHRIDARHGYSSELDSSPPPVARRRPDRIASLGAVCRVDDPEQLGRVQVMLPACGGLESGWMEVLSAGAGSGKGMVAMPDVGDDVLVLFPDGDSARGVVLGGMYGAHGPPDGSVYENRIGRYTIRTAAGHRLIFDDRHQLLRLEDKQGSFVELAPSHLQLHAHQVPLIIEAPGKTVTIRGALIDLVRG